MKYVIALWMSFFALFAPAHARAGTPYTIHWDMTEDPLSCEDATLSQPTYFDVNGTPVPTFAVPGAYEVLADSSRINTAEAPFDSVLLRWGSNGFFFHVRNRDKTGKPIANDCVHSAEVVHLVSAPLGLSKLLFDVRRDG